MRGRDLLVRQLALSVNTPGGVCLAITCMHVALRNPYEGPVSYAELSQAVPLLVPFLRPGRDGRQTIDFQDDSAVRALNIALLKRDFGLDLALPQDRLCPAVQVPSRYEYVLFVLKLALLTASSPSAEASASSLPRPLVGLDIGTGASAIYPLLAARAAERSEGTDPFASQDAGIRMLATDIDRHSMEFARKNIEVNHLEDRIALFQVEDDQPIFRQDVVESVDSIDFTMCNPPFYSSQSEIDQSLASKELEPFANCTGAENEMITEGGEVAFVTRMINESLSLGRSRIRWFTSLLGKHSSIALLVDLLKSSQILNYHVHALPVHGHTARWVLAWSLQDWRFPAELAATYVAAAPLTSSAPIASAPTTPRFALGRFASPAVTVSTFYTPSLSSDAQEHVPRVVQVIEAILRELVDGGARPRAISNDRVTGDSGRLAKQRRLAIEAEEHDAQSDGARSRAALEWAKETSPSSTMNTTAGASGDAVDKTAARVDLFVRAWRNVWSRRARRANTRVAAEPATHQIVEKDPRRPLLELRIRVEAEPPPSSQVRITAYWVRGFDADRAAFTGLFGFVTRRIGERFKAEGSAQDDADTERKAQR